MTVTAVPPRRYLDNAATSWPKPGSVVAAWNDAVTRVGSAAGRAGYREALEADAIVRRARQVAAGLLGGVDPRRVALPAGCTLALSMAIHGLVRPGDHVIATAADHNATLRPLRWLEQAGTIEVTILPCDGLGRVDPDEVARAWRPATRIVVVSHASNVTGAVQDLPAFVAHAHGRGGLVILDAAQSLGIVPFSTPAGGADVVAAPAHKWLHGTSGAAMLWCREGVEPVPIVQGGTGSASDSLEMPTAFAERMEPGTPDVPAVAALAAAGDWLAIPPTRAACARAQGLAMEAAARLRECRGVQVQAAGHGPPIVSFTVEHYAPDEVAAILEASVGVQVRSGFHCAALVHEHVGTREGGTVRASFGPSSTADDLEALCRAVEEIAG